MPVRLTPLRNTGESPVKRAADFGHLIHVLTYVVGDVGFTRVRMVRHVASAVDQHAVPEKHISFFGRYSTRSYFVATSERC